MATKPELPIIPFASRDAWAVWLDEHHATSDGVWLKIAKKGSGIETVSYAKPSTQRSATAGSMARRPGWTNVTGCSGSHHVDQGASGRRSTARRPRNSSRRVR